MYRLVLSITPSKIRNGFTQLLIYAHNKTDPDKYLSFIIIFGFVLSMIIAVLSKIFFKFNFILAFLISFIVIEFIFYFLILIKADKRSDVIEKHLPDALQLMASNLRAGLTVDRALLLSTRPEFGALKEEINLVGKQITTGKSIISALLDATTRVKSKSFKKTILLIVSGLKSGGELASLLEKTAEDLIDKRLVDKKVRSNVNLYVIFIFLAIGVGAPLLFGLSSYLIEILTGILSKVEIPKTSTVRIPFSISPNSAIEPGFILTFALTFLITSVILGSLVIGLIMRGKEKHGVKYIIPLLIISVGLFFLVRLIVSNIFGDVFLHALS